MENEKPFVKEGQVELEKEDASTSMLGEKVEALVLGRKETCGVAIFVWELRFSFHYISVHILLSGFGRDAWNALMQFRRKLAREWFSKVSRDSHSCCFPRSTFTLGQLAACDYEQI